MGFKKDWNIVDIASQISRMTYECTSPYNDGFNAWGIKQDLYRLKWVLEDALARCSTFTPEAEWLEKHEQDITIKILKGN